MMPKEPTGVWLPPRPAASRPQDVLRTPRRIITIGVVVVLVVVDLYLLTRPTEVDRLLDMPDCRPKRAHAEQSRS